MKKALIILFTSIFLALTKITSALAVCPVCTAAVVGGVGLSRYLKIDDTITGLWIGGFIVSTIMWTISWLNKKGIRFFGRKPLIIALYYITVIAPLYWYNIIGHPANQIFGIDKIIFGIICGSILFFSGAIFYEVLKRKNKGKSYFHFQKIAMPILPLIVFSFIFYFATKYYKF